MYCITSIFIFYQKVGSGWRGRRPHSPTLTDSEPEESSPRPAPRSRDQDMRLYEREIERLQASVDLLKMKLEMVDHQADHLPAPAPPPTYREEPDNMKNIISR